MIKRTLYCIIVIAAVVLTSCRENCYLPSRSLLGVAFVDSLSNQAINLNSLTVKAVGCDSVLYKNVTDKFVSLPLHITSNETDYKFAAAAFTEESDSVKFTLKVYHTSAPQFVSPECGCVPYYKVDSVIVESETRRVTGVELYDDNVVNAENSVHVKIYF